jgi:hypothetical protein
MVRCLVAMSKTKRPKISAALFYSLDPDSLPYYLGPKNNQSVNTLTGDTPKITSRIVSVPPNRARTICALRVGTCLVLRLSFLKAQRRHVESVDDANLRSEFCFTDNIMLQQDVPLDLSNANGTTTAETSTPERPPTPSVETRTSFDIFTHHGDGAV